MTIAIEHGTFPQRLEVPLSDPFSTSTTLLVLRARPPPFPVGMRPAYCLWGVGGVLLHLSCSLSWDQGTCHYVGVPLVEN